MLFIYKQLPIFDWKPCKGDDDSMMLRFKKDGQKREIIVSPCVQEPTTDFVCGAASMADSLAVYHAECLNETGFQASIFRAASGHPVIDVSGRGLFCVQYKEL